MSKTYVPALLRRKVTERGQGCCEYCLRPELFSLSVHEIDHVIAEKHGGTTTEDNLAIACKLCNTLKGSDIASIDPQTDEVTALYNPRRDHWVEHFQLNKAEFTPLSDRARTTIRLLQLNQSSTLKERSLWLASGLIRISD
jgi:HNH endonuclease